MSKKKSAIDIIRETLQKQEELRLALVEQRKAAAEQVGELQEQIDAQVKAVAVKKAEFDAEMNILNELQATMAIVVGKPTKKSVTRSGGVKDTFRKWILTEGNFTIKDLIDAGITPSGGYARILVTGAIADKLLVEVADTKPQAYRSV